MNPRLKKILLLLLSGVLLAGVSQLQPILNRDRNELGLTRVEPLENAPPVLAFTTVALGGFRGLIANALWIRATEMQDEDKFFEMAQLADWITKLEPHFVQVWLVQAWNMAYNISVKFKDYEDRWRWVRRGISLLRDDGLRYNPNEVLIYRELAWFFQHKMGQNLDDANILYKQEWANEMAQIFGEGKMPNLTGLTDPQTPEDHERIKLLKETYKMDPEMVLTVEETYGPLEWRLPESHAIYWAAEGLKRARQNPTKVNAQDLIQLRRVIYQSMHMAAQRGRLVFNPLNGGFQFGPNLDIIPKTNFAYEQAMEEDAENREHISKAHRNFVRESVYQLYLHNRLADAAKWYEYLGTHYPDKPIVDGDTNSLPRNITLDQYAMANLRVDVTETDQKRIQSITEAFIARSYESLLLDEDERAAGYVMLAQKVRNAYMKAVEGRAESIPVTPINETQQEILKRMLDPNEGLPYEARAILRTKLRMEPEPPPIAPDTNAPPASATSTNAPGAG